MIWSNWKTKCMSHLDLEYVFVCASFATWAKSRQVSLKKSKFSVRFWNPKGIMVKSPNVVQVPIIYLYPIGAPYYIIDKLWVGFELMASLSAHLTLKQSWSLRRDSLRFLKHKDFLTIQWSKKCAKNSINYFLHLLHNSSHSEITFIWIFFTLWESIIFSPPRPLCTVIMIYTIVGSIPFVTFWHHFHLFSMKQKMCKKHAKNSISYFLHPRPLCTVITVYTVVGNVHFVAFWHQFHLILSEYAKNNITYFLYPLDHFAQ